MSNLVRHAQAYLFNRDQTATFTKIRDREKSWLKDFIQESGKKDPKGNINVYFDDPLTIGKKTYYGLQQRKIPGAPFMDSDEVRKFVETLDFDVQQRVIYDITEEYIDTEELYVLAQEKIITEAAVRKLVRHKKPTYQLWPIEEPEESDE